MKIIAFVILVLLGTTACTSAKVTPSSLGAERPPAKIALAFGGGAARGFAHIGVNKNINGRPIEKLNKTFAADATNLRTGEMMDFSSGNTGLAVRASSSVPVFFEPVTINDQDYVDGGMVAPVPASVARTLGADFVIAVDISDRPQDRSTAGITDILLQTFAIFGQTINRRDQSSADIIIRPVTLGLPSTDTSGRNKAVLEGEKAVAAILPELKAKQTKLNEQKHVAGMS